MLGVVKDAIALCMDAVAFWWVCSMAANSAWKAARVWSLLQGVIKISVVLWGWGGVVVVVALMLLSDVFQFCLVQRKTLFGTFVDVVFVVKISSVDGFGGFEEHHCAMVRHSHRAMFQSFGNGDEFTGVDIDVALSKLHAHSTSSDKENFVFVLVGMPDEFTFHACKFDLKIVYVGGNSGIPRFVDIGKGGGQVDFGRESGEGAGFGECTAQEVSGAKKHGVPGVPGVYQVGG